MREVQERGGYSPEDQEVETEVFRARRALLIYILTRTSGTGAVLLTLLWEPRMQSTGRFQRFP